jgi:hypothetical protein
VIHILASSGTALCVSGMVALFDTHYALLIIALGIVLILMERVQTLRRMKFMEQYA